MRILFGVHGTGRGHAMRALAIARHFREHEFKFISHGQGADILAREYAVVRVPNPVTPVKSHAVDFATLAIQNAGFFARQAGLLKKAMRGLESFSPEFVLSDYEYFAPLIARNLGVRSLSIDNQHLLTMCSLPASLSRGWAAFSAKFAIKTFFSSCDSYLINSFFDAPVKAGMKNVSIFPSLLRERLFDFRGEEGAHIVSYQCYDVFKDYFALLKETGRMVHVYGTNLTGRDGKLLFKAYSEDGFISSLASCAYLVCGGGHTAISEALYYRKPVFAIPVRGAFEQFLNGFQLRENRWGDFAEAKCLSPDALAGFEMKIDSFRREISRNDFCGNDKIFAHIKTLLDP